MSIEFDVAVMARCMLSSDDLRAIREYWKIYWKTGSEAEAAKIVPEGKKAIMKEIFWEEAFMNAGYDTPPFIY